MSRYLQENTATTRDNGTIKFKIHVSNVKILKVEDIGAMQVT